MERIVDQTIPAAVDRQPARRLESVHERGDAAPPAIEVDDAPRRRRRRDSDAREPDVRYAQLLDIFRAARQADPYSPDAPDAASTAGSTSEREMPEARVDELLERRPDVAAGAAGSPTLIEQRLGRPLEPHDLWYTGFSRARSSPRRELDARPASATRPPRRSRRTCRASCTELGLLARAGALPRRPHRGRSRARRRPRASAPRAAATIAHLRTRVDADGMDYKGYNIAVHELGHNVEQVFSLYDMDHTLLRACPTTRSPRRWRSCSRHGPGAARPGRRRDAESERLRRAQRLLGDLRDRRRGAGRHRGVALDVRAPRRDARPSCARRSSASPRDVWNRYYAPVLRPARHRCCWASTRT